VFAPCLLRLTKNEVKLLGPGEERCGSFLALLVGLCAFQPVKNFVAIVDAGAALVFAQQRHRVTERADDPTITQIELRLYPIFARLCHRGDRPLVGCVAPDSQCLSGNRGSAADT
jgi:hypothetical protein